MSKLETNTIDTVSGTTNLVIGSTNTSTIALGASGDTVTVPNGALTGQNYPAFYGRKNGNQTLTRGTITKITSLDLNEFDTDSAFDGTTFTVPLTGKYMVSAQIHFYYGDAGNDGEVQQLYLYKNGTSIMSSFLQHSGSGRDVAKVTIPLNVIVPLTATDTLELYGKMGDNVASGTLRVVDGETFFSAYRIGA